MTFQDRSNNFQVDIKKLQEKHGVVIYPAQVLLQDGELVLTLKLRDLLPPETKVMDTKTYDDKPKKGNPINS